MSVSAASGANGLKATTNLSSSTNCTKMLWAQHSGNPSGYNPFLGSYDGSVAHYNEINTTSGPQLDVHTESGTNAAGSTPTLTDWVCYALVMGSAGAGSVKAYWQDNSGGGWYSWTETGSAFTNANDGIGGVINNLNVGMTFAYYKEWASQLNTTQLGTEFLSATPVLTTGLSRYCPLTNSSNWGQDTENGYNLSTIGTLSAGASSPTFPSTVNPLMLLNVSKVLPILPLAWIINRRNKFRGVK